MRKHIFSFAVALFLFLAILPGMALAAPKKVVATPTPTPTVSPTPIPTPTVDLTQKVPQTLGPLEELLKNQKLGPVWPGNPIKYAIRAAVTAGVPANTIVLLLLLPVIATVIAASRHLIGLRGFGIFLPAALSVVFVATGPIVGIALFLLIVGVSILMRFLIRIFKIKIQYLPRAALLIWTVAVSVLGVLFLVPIVKVSALTNVSIFAVLFLALLAEDFTRVQLGKSAKTAVSLTTETLILSLASYYLLTLKALQNFALLNPEALLIGVFITDFILGRYTGLRFLEYIRFRKLIRS